jgi:hypothetical protein
MRNRTPRVCTMNMRSGTLRVCTVSMRSGTQVLYCEHAQWNTGAVLWTCAMERRGSVLWTCAVERRGQQQSLCALTLWRLPRDHRPRTKGLALHIYWCVRRMKWLEKVAHVLLCVFKQWRPIWEHLRRCPLELANVGSWRPWLSAHLRSNE